MYSRAVDRRFGKTTLGINRCVTPDVLSYPVGWFGPTYKMLQEVWREAVRVLQPITARVSASENRIENIAGGVLEFWSLDNPDSARGHKYKRIIIDEAAMVPNLMDAWQYALRSTLVDYTGDAWFLSTPKGRDGFWQMWQRGQDSLMPEWASWQMPSSANPKIKQSELDALRATMPERVYHQEILAQFLEDGGGVFRRVMEAATAEQEDYAQEDQEYVIGLDWGKLDDFSSIAVLNTTRRACVYLDRFNRIDYTFQLGRLRALFERFHPTAIMAERNSMGEPLIEQLRRAGLPVQAFWTSNASKTAAIEGLALAFEQGALSIINDPVLVGELLAYEMERLPGGLIRYGAPAGMHDDTVMALALAWAGVGQRIEYAPSIWG